MSATPILDLEADPPQPARNRFGRSAGLAIGGVTGYFVAARGGVQQAPLDSRIDCSAEGCRK